MTVFLIIVFTVIKETRQGLQGLSYCIVLSNVHVIATLMSTFLQDMTIILRYCRLLYMQEQIDPVIFYFFYFISFGFKQFMLFICFLQQYSKFQLYLLSKSFIRLISIQYLLPYLFFFSTQFTDIIFTQDIYCAQFPVIFSHRFSPVQ